MHPDPRASLHRGQHRSENEARKDYDFRFHGIAVIEYIYAHDDPSCNTDCCRVCGNLGFVTGCESVKSTAAYFEPTSGRAWPAKPLDTAIPILNGPSKRPIQSHWEARI